MKQKSLTYLLASIFASGIATAAPIYLNRVINPFLNVDIASFYLRNYAFIDAILYLMLFLSIAQMVFLKVYSKSGTFGADSNRKEAKMVAVAVGLILTVSMIVTEVYTGFNLSQLMPIAAVTLLLALAIFLYNMLLGLFPGKVGEDGKPGKSGIAAAVTYLVIYGLLVVPFDELNRWIQRTSPLLASVLNLMALACFIFLVLSMFSIFSTGGSSTGPQGERGPPGGQGPPGEVGPPGGQGPPPDNPPEIPPTTNMPNTVELRQPSADGSSQYMINDPIMIEFYANGTDINSGLYSYEIYINRVRFSTRRIVRGNIVRHNVTPRAGTIPTHIGDNDIQIVLYARNTNRILTTSAVVNFVINTNPATNIINNELNNVINILNDIELLYRGIHPDSLVRSVQRLLIMRAAVHPAPPAQPYFNDVIRAYYSVITQISNVTTRLELIIRHDDFPRLNAADRNLVIAQMDRLTMLSRGIEDFMNTAAAHYNVGDPRSPLAGP
ncbi:MAG: hypothetical protein ACP5NW_01285 [Candidatus Woesearchaeota archaeon]